MAGGSTARVSVWRKCEAEEEIPSCCASLGFYTAAELSSSRCRGRRARQRRDEDEHGVVLSTMHGGRDEDDLLLLFFCRRGKLAGPGCYLGWFWAQAWASVRPLHGLHGQVSVSPIFLFCFYFPVLYLSIEIHIWVWFTFADLSIMQISIKI
jgi:hypothetical protein